MPLSDLAIRNAKPKPKPYKLTDSAGLHLYVTTNGGKLWRMQYRFAGKQKQLAFGAYPALSLAEARQKRETARKDLAAGLDPSETKKEAAKAALLAQQAAVPAPTFLEVARDYLDRMDRAGAAPKTYSKNRWMLIDLVCPDLGARPIVEITSPEVLEVLQQVEATGRLETARRLRSVISGVFKLAIMTARATSDPSAVLTGVTVPPKVVHRASVTDEKGVGGLIRSVREYDGWPTLKAAQEFLALTATRPGEVRFAAWSEIDLDGGRWTIPAERMKMREMHAVPLSTQAVSLLRQVHRISGKKDLVFPAIRGYKPLSENAFNSMLRRIGYSTEEATAHGWRSTFSTVLNERGYDSDLIEYCLAHRVGSKVKQAYDRATRFSERATLMQTWADILDTLALTSHH